MFVRFIIGIAVLALIFAAALVRMTQVVDGDLATTPPELTDREQKLALSIDQQITHLATVIGQRNGSRTGSLLAAEDYLKQQLIGQGLTVTREAFTVEGTEVANLVVEITGATRASEIVLIGAHYDSYARSPSANASASGSAVLVELAGQVAGKRMARTVRFVLFTTGEYPYAGTDQSGAVYHAKQATAKGENIVAVLSLGSLGSWATSAGTQKFPFPMGFCYPDTGDFLAVFGVGSSRHLVEQVGSGLHGTGMLRVRGGTLPTWWPGMDARGDHMAFADAGFPTVLISDTGDARDPLLRTPSDSKQRLDSTQLVRVTLALTNAVQQVANAAR